MAKLTGMVKRGSVYWLRVRVPKDLVSALKKREITFSLRTSDRKEAETKAMAERLRVQLDFGMHRRGQSQPVALKQLKELSPEEIQDLVLSWFHDLEVKAVREDAASPTPRGTGEHHELLIDLRQDMASMHAELSGNNHPSDPIWADKPISNILSAKGMTLPPGAQSREQLRRLILRGLMEARRRMHERLGGGTPDERDGYFTSVDPDAPPPQPKAVKQLGPTLRQLLEQFLKEQAPKNLRKKTLGQYDAVVGRFEEVAGADTPISEITRKHFVAFRDLWAQMPPNASKRFRGMKMQQVANLPKEKKGEALNPRTVNKSLETLSGLFAYAEASGLITMNYARKLGVPEGEVKIDRTFGAEQLRQLFAAEVFSKYVLSDDPRQKNSRFWVPLIALYSGLRQNEICQLFVEDIKEENGVPFFSVRAILDDRSTTHYKHLKNRNAWRRMPIHPTLVQLGFLELVSIKKAAGEERIFSELTYFGAAENYSDSFQKWFSRLLRQTGTIAEKRVTFHGFRHTFRDALRRGGVSKEHAQALGGWKADESLSEHYGQGYPLDILHREISKVSYLGIPPTSWLARGRDT